MPSLTDPYNRTVFGRGEKCEIQPVTEYPISPRIRILAQLLVVSPNKLVLLLRLLRMILAMSMYVVGC